MSVIYDLLNRVSLDGRLAPSSTGESALALEQLALAALGDVTINDRGYTSYRYLASVRAQGLHYGPVQKQIRRHRRYSNKLPH